MYEIPSKFPKLSGSCQSAQLYQSMLLVVKFALRANTFAEDVPVRTFHHIDKCGNVWPGKKNRLMQQNSWKWSWSCLEVQCTLHRLQILAEEKMKFICIRNWPHMCVAFTLELISVMFLFVETSKCTHTHKSSLTKHTNTSWTFTSSHTHPHTTFTAQ